MPPMRNSRKTIVLTIAHAIDIRMGHCPYGCEQLLTKKPNQQYGGELLFFHAIGSVSTYLLCF